MVTFQMIEEGVRYVIYWYYPEGNAKKEHGIIVIDKELELIKVSKLAEDDFSNQVSVEEQNELRESINRMRRQENIAVLTEEEWPMSKKVLVRTFFADHAISKISESYNKGIVLKEGTVVWY